MKNTSQQSIIARKLANGAAQCEANGDFQRARTLYISAAECYVSAIKETSSKQIQDGFQRLVEVYIAKARQLRGKKSQQFVIPLGTEYGFVIVEKDAPNPFRITPEITTIANQCAAGKIDLEGKLRSIFTWVEANINYGDKERGSKNYRRSDEVIKSGEGVCGEDAYLYIVMARYVGAKCRFMKVGVDCYGKPANHACVRVQSPREFSSDITYHMFDVVAQSRNDHQRFEVLTDEDAIEIFRQWR